MFHSGFKTFLTMWKVDVMQEIKENFQAKTGDQNDDPDRAGPSGLYVPPTSTAAENAPGANSNQELKRESDLTTAQLEGSPNVKRMKNDTSATETGEFTLFLSLNE